MIDLARGTDARLTLVAAGINPIWSPDGRFILYAQLNVGAGSGRTSASDLFAVSVEEGEPLAVAQTPNNKDQGQLSPYGAGSPARRTSPD